MHTMPWEVGPMVRQTTPTHRYRMLTPTEGLTRRLVINNSRLTPIQVVQVIKYHALFLIILQVPILTVIIKE